MDQPSEAVAGEGNAEQQIGDETNETTATDNGNGKVRLVQHKVNQNLEP